MRTDFIAVRPAASVRIAALYGVVSLLHLAGWGLYLHYAAAYPPIVGMGFAAYMFGLRHAFDADHIAAIDDTVRLMLQQGKQPVGLGFFFSLGHSTIVLALVLAVAFAAAKVESSLPGLRDYGDAIGAGVSGLFLWMVGILNTFVLLDILKVWKKAKSGAHSHAHIDDLLARRGLINRLSGGRLPRLMNHSWQMYPVGLLFGLGFDTASEVGLLAMTAAASVGNLPVPALLSLPILFAAGMTMMDTTDGILMLRAYNWAFVNPLRRIFYNITTTGLSIAVALLIGSMQLSRVAVRAFNLHGAFYGWVAGLNIGMLGYLIVGMFGVAWAAAACWRSERAETRHLHSNIRLQAASPARDNV